MSDLHPQLATDCIVLRKLRLCHLLLMNDASYPWFILVPDRDDITEIYQLSNEDQLLLQQESTRLGAFLMKHFKGDKLNIAALGNIVPQLHIHHIVRYERDIAWPKPVWGLHLAVPYRQDKLDGIRTLMESFEG